MCLDRRKRIFFLKLIGYNIENAENLISVSSLSFDIIIARMCTGIDWLLIAIPFVLCYSNKFMYNIINVFALIFIWFFVNIIRIWILVEFTSRNYNWWISHHIPYMILYYGTLLIIVGTWSKNRIRIKFIKKREHKTITSLSI